MNGDVDRETERYFFLDNLKFILMVFVVWEHGSVFANQNSLCNLIDQFIVSFHMPLFIFCAGILHKNTNIKNRIIKLLLTYFIYNFSIWIVNRNGNPITEVLGASWFVLAIALYTLATYMLKEIDGKVVISIVMLICICMLFDSHFNFNSTSVIYKYRILNWFLFYYGGYLIGYQKVIQWYSDRCRRVVILSIAIIVVFTMVTLSFSNDSFNYETLIALQVFPNGEYRTVLGAFLKVIAILITIVTGAGIMAAIPQKSCGWVTKCGRRTLQVYYWHYIMRFFILKLPDKVFKPLSLVDPSGG